MVSPLYSIVSEFLTGRLTQAVGLVVVLQQPSWRSFRSCPHVRGYFATLCVLAFVPLQTGFLVTRTDLYKCPLSVQNYRFLKITISGHLCGQNRPFVKRWHHHQSVPIPGLQILILLCRTPPCLIQTHQASDVSNTWLR